MAEVEGDRLLKRKGRPVGSKDAGPRKRSDNSSPEQATNSSDSGSAQRDTSSSESGSAPRESSSSDGGTARQSDTTGSRNQTSGDSGENSNGSQQESASTSGRENSSSGSGDSSPRQCETSAAPSTSEQNARNAQLNQAVLSLINTDWRHSVTAQHARNNIPAFAPTNIQGAFQSAPQCAQVGASQSLQQLLGQWQASQNPSPSPRNNASYGSSLQSALGYTQAQPAPNFAHQSPSPSPASTIAHAPPFQMAPWQMASRAAAPPQQSSAPSPGPFYVQDHAPATPALNQALFSLPLKRPPPCDYAPAPAPAQRCFKFDSSTGPALPLQLNARVPMLGGYGQSCPQPGPGILGGSYMPPHQNMTPTQQQNAPEWQFNSHMPGHY